MPVDSKRKVWEVDWKGDDRRAGRRSCPMPAPMSLTTARYRIPYCGQFCFNSIESGFKTLGWKSRHGDSPGEIFHLPGFEIAHKTIALSGCSNHHLGRSKNSASPPNKQPLLARRPPRKDLAIPDANDMVIGMDEFLLVGHNHHR